MSTAVLAQNVNLALSHQNATPTDEGLVLFDDGTHRWIWLGADDGLSEGVSANQYLIQNGNSVCLLDPGSVLDFARSVANIARYVSTKQIDYLFYSHQDPDVSSGAPMWCSITNAQVLISALWGRFLPHFGTFDQKRLSPIPDQGDTISLGTSQLKLIPAHFMHSPGNFIVYDPHTKFLFSGDIGANLVPSGSPLFIEDLDPVRQYFEGFHQRYMSGNRACRALVKQLSKLEIDAILPQHGSIFRGPAVPQFLNWLKDLQCGVDLLEV